MIKADGLLDTLTTMSRSTEETTAIASNDGAVVK
jgi:hypothetical protein